MIRNTPYCGGVRVPPGSGWPDKIRHAGGDFSGDQLGESHLAVLDNTEAGCLFSSLGESTVLVRRRGVFESLMRLDSTRCSLTPDTGHHVINAEQHMAGNRN